MIARVWSEARRVAIIQAGIRDDFLEFPVRDGLLDHPLDLGDNGGGLLDARAFGGADDHREIPRVDFGEEFGVQPGKQQRAGHDQRQQRRDDHEELQAETDVQHLFVAGQEEAEPTLGRRAFVFRPVSVTAAIEPGEDDRRHGHGDGIVGQHRVGDRQCQRHEQILDDAGEKYDRQIDDQDADRGDKDRQRQFGRAVFRSRAAVFAHFKMPVKIFLNDDVVVEQCADHEGQPAQRHDVDALPAEKERHQRRGQ